MKVVHINTYNTGGAAKACLRLHESLLKQGVNSSVLLLYKIIDQKGVVSFWTYMHNPFIKLMKLIQSKFLRFMQKRQLKTLTPSSELFSFPNSCWDITKHPLFKEADIVHLHWVAGFLDYETFFKKCDKPVVWTLHDFNPFSEGFHYPVEDKHEGSTQSKFENYRRIKKNAVSNSNLSLISPSAFLAKISHTSLAFRNKQHCVIPNGLDIQQYTYTDQVETRKQLKLPLDKQIILFVADSVDDRRKGFDLFEQAIQVMQNEVLVCIMGKKDKRLKILEKSSVKELGHISDEILLSKIYTSASLFVCASRMDNLPNTIMESLCCGTPVVAFRTGGIPEMIINEENGILANAIDVKNLREAIERALKMKFDRQAISKKASEKYSMNRQSNEVYGVYQKILTSKVF